ncbi:hypothetical protein [Arthrobacter rhombi]|uniref:hypothetical protein n=1 Tax=Arthrobacter rhombi TaxID=71253 RepID=UPI003FD4665A
MTVTPLKAATDVLDRAEAMLALDASPASDLVREDIRRLSWAMASASIDTFLHWRVARVDLNTDTLHRELRNLDVGFGDLVRMGRGDVLARRENRNNRPLVRVRNVLHERILRDTFQSKKGIERALNMCGIPDIWGSLAREMGETKTEIIDHVNSLANRRNAIVHEGDIQRQSKPRAIKHHPIESTDITMELAWVRKFVMALNVVAS